MGCLPTARLQHILRVVELADRSSTPRPRPTFAEPGRSRISRAWAGWVSRLARAHKAGAFLVLVNNTYQYNTLTLQDLAHASHVTGHGALARPATGSSLGSDRRQEPRRTNLARVSRAVKTSQQRVHSDKERRRG